MATRLGVRPSTFSEWKSLHTELAEAIKKGSDQFVAAGIDALEISAIARATGYMVTEAETVTEEGPRGPITRTKTTIRHVPADPALTHLAANHPPRRHISAPTRPKKLRRGRGNCSGRSFWKSQA